MFSRKKPSRLSEDDLRLWREVVKSAVPLHPSAPTVPITDPGKVVPPKRPEPLAFDQSPAKRGKGSVSLDLAPEPSARLARDPVKMDARRFGKLKRGKLAPEDRIDLHGLTLDEAHAELVPFVLSAWSSGLRLVLVITGKGKPRDDGHAVRPGGVLRQQVPHWLMMPPLAPIVLQVSEAHQRHGGGGALYVYLKRQDRSPF